MVAEGEAAGWAMEAEDTVVGLVVGSVVVAEEARVGAGAAAAEVVGMMVAAAGVGVQAGWGWGLALSTGLGVVAGAPAPMVAGVPVTAAAVAGVGAAARAEAAGPVAGMVAAGPALRLGTSGWTSAGAPVGEGRAAGVERVVVVRAAMEGRC